MRYPQREGEQMKIERRYVGFRIDKIAHRALRVPTLITLRIDKLQVRRADKAMRVAGYCRLPAVKK